LARPRSDGERARRGPFLARPALLMRHTIVVAALLLGCGGPSTMGATPTPIASRQLTQLKHAGLDPRSLPQSLAGLTPTAIDLVMTTFSTSLGTDCNGCHDPNDSARATRQLNIANKMWSDLAGKLQLADGSALYCDSCHQGRATFLDRGDTHALGLWMESRFVKDHKPNDCVTCHGSPYDPRFLDGWAAGKGS
jgi:hypothetical protein